jgi:predicted nucleic acid-binding protein
MSDAVIVDTNVLVAALDDRDTWHRRATALLDSLLDSSAELLYLDVVISESNGVLNFNDALIAITARKLNVEQIASFDADFDQVSWLKRLK